MAEMRRGGRIAQHTPLMWPFFHLPDRQACPAVPEVATFRETAYLSHQEAGEEEHMEGKARFIFPVTMAFFMALLMTAVVTFINLGLPADFIFQWLKAFAVAWPLASVVAFIAVPLARRITAKIVALVGP